MLIARDNAIGRLKEEETRNKYLRSKAPLSISPLYQKWIDEGKNFISSSAMRYCKEYEPYHLSTHELGDLRYVNITMAKSWEKYGIHALETLYPITGPGFESIQNLGDKQSATPKKAKGQATAAKKPAAVDAKGGMEKPAVGTAQLTSPTSVDPPPFVDKLTPYSYITSAFDNSIGYFSVFLIPIKRPLSIQMLLKTQKTFSLVFSLECAWSFDKKAIHCITHQ